MRFTTIIGLSTVIAGVLLLPGLVLGVPGADPADTTDTAAPSVTIDAADAPGGAALTQTTSASPHGTVTIDTATLRDVHAAGSTARVFTVTNTDTQAAAVWIETETDSLTMAGVENGETLDTAATAATLEPGETVGDALDQLLDRFPALAERVCEGDVLADDINLLHNGTAVDTTGGLSKPLTAGDELALFPPVSGGNWGH